MLATRLPRLPAILAANASYRATAGYPLHSLDMSAAQSRYFVRNFSSSPLRTFKPSFYTLLSMQQESDPKPTDPQTHQKYKDETPVERAIRDAKNASVDAQNAASNESAVKAVEVKKAPLSQRIKDELVHYWHGTKLLGKEIGISSRLCGKLLQGNKLSRREQRQLKRTLTDIARVVPFVIIVLIPFLEFALPLILKLFPNMLPSTFESKFQEEEKKKKLLMLRLEMAKFLQETVSEMSIEGSGTALNAKELTDFFNKYRMTGEIAPTQEIIGMAKKFQDSLTLTNLSRPQLVSMCKYLNINAFGTDSFLRNQIESRLRNLKADDMLIATEGVDTLSLPELQQVCQSRGIRTLGISPARLRKELNQWLELHLTYQIPGSLVILSRAFMMSDRLPKDSNEALEGSAQALQATLSSLPEQVVNEAALQFAEAAGTATAKQKLGVLQEQEELIADELEQEEAQLAAKKVREQQDVEAKSAQTTTADQDLSELQIQQIAEAVKTLNGDSAFKEQLKDFKNERKEYKEDIIELTSVTHKPSTQTQSPLNTKIDQMIQSIEFELEKYESSITPTSDPNDRLIVLKPDDQGRLTIESLEQVLSMIKGNPGDDRIKEIVKRLDADGDGMVGMEEIMRLAEEAGRKNGHGVVIPKDAAPVVNAPGQSGPSA